MYLLGSRNASVYVCTKRIISFNFSICKMVTEMATRILHIQKLKLLKTSWGFKGRQQDLEQWREKDLNQRFFFFSIFPNLSHSLPILTTPTLPFPLSALLLLNHDWNKKRKLEREAEEGI